MANKTYFYPKGGLPSQNRIASDRSVFKTAYAVIPQTVMKDIVVSYFPFWERSRAWVLARPMSGFAETFSQSLVEIQPKGGSKKKPVGLVFIAIKNRNKISLNKCQFKNRGRIFIQKASVKKSLSLILRSIQ